MELSTRSLIALLSFVFILTSCDAHNVRGSRAIKSNNGERYLQSNNNNSAKRFRDISKRTVSGNSKQIQKPKDNKIANKNNKIANNKASSNTDSDSDSRNNNEQVNSRVSTIKRISVQSDSETPVVTASRCQSDVLCQSMHGDTAYCTGRGLCAFLRVDT